MSSHQRMPTWLELTLTAVQGKVSEVGLHRVGDCGDGCVALSLHGSVLLDGEGRKTVFRTPAVAQRFIECSGGSATPSVVEEPLVEVLDGGAALRCFDIARKGRLVSCKGCNQATLN